MAEPRRFLDVWIIDSNTVYREVPYSVVADWVQQGRLLESDRLRPSGTAQWFPLASMPAFAAYLPKEEPYRSEDRAEALEPVQVDFAWKRGREDEDEDVDMIPLIDVSLVLLIFFMMTATVAGAGIGIFTPEVQNATDLASGPLWVGILRGADGTPRYLLGDADQGPRPGDTDLNEKELLQHLDERLTAGKAVDVTIKADKTLPYDVIRRMTGELQKRHFRGQIRYTYAEVTSRPNP
jgi:biopolymer transport protein ExbD